MKTISRFKIVYNPFIFSKFHEANNWGYKKIPKELSFSTALIEDLLTFTQRLFSLISLK